MRIIDDADASSRVVILGTGGTIAGVSTEADDRSYQAAQLSVAQLVGAVPALAGSAIEAHQVAQLDSKDMGWAVWRDLVAALMHHRSREDVAGVVVTHGTDTLEETALLLQLLLPPGKPVVLTAAMRPATSAQADGPGNLADAVRTVRAWGSGPGASSGRQAGVGVVLGGRLWSALDIRKAHTLEIDAFDGGGAPILAEVNASALAWGPRPWPLPQAWVSAGLMARPHLPRVEIITSHADADGAVVDALLAASRKLSAKQGQPLAGLVVASTGHGTVHCGLQAALSRAAQAGVAVWRSTRVARGGVLARPRDDWPAAGPLTPAQARVALALALAVRPELASQPWESWSAT